MTGEQSGAAVRAATAQVVARVLGGESLDGPLAEARTEFDNTQDQALLAALAFGTLRNLTRGQALVKKLSRGRRPEPIVEALILVGLEQLAHSRIPPHAAVSSTVEAARVLGKGRASGFVNALLRRFQRERSALMKSLKTKQDTRFAHPEWWVKAMQRDWPKHWRAILEANNLKAPMWLRANRTRTTRDEYQAKLAAAGHSARAGKLADTALCLDEPVPVTSLPGFADGDVSVQDQSAQLAAELLQPEPDHRVLDACAAPGGKTAHLLEYAPGIELVALDVSPERTGKITENLDRIGVSATVVTGDATAPKSWWDGVPFDRILVDAPCSGSGVIRRHPDIKLLRRPTDIDGLVATQERMLAALWPLLRPSGRLLYATCSVLRAENGGVISRFVEAVPNAREIRIDPRAGWGLAGAPGRQILPGEDDSDGFYYACLKKDR